MWLEMRNTLRAPQRLDPCCRNSASQTPRLIRVTMLTARPSDGVRCIFECICYFVYPFTSVSIIHHYLRIVNKTVANINVVTILCCLKLHNVLGYSLNVKLVFINHCYFNWPFCAHCCS